MYSSQIYIYAMTGDFTYPTRNNGKKRYIDDSFFIEKKNMNFCSLQFYNDLPAGDSIDSID